MTSDATSDPNDGVSVDGTGQNQSDVFRGESHVAESRRGSTEKGISSRSVPAFVAGEELADLAEFDSNKPTTSAPTHAARPATPHASDEEAPGLPGCRSSVGRSEEHRWLPLQCRDDLRTLRQVLGSAR